MANMAYCRFRNTEGALADCYDNLWDIVSKEEHLARLRIIKMCKDIADEVDDEEWLMDREMYDGV